MATLATRLTWPMPARLTPKRKRRKRAVIIAIRDWWSYATRANETEKRMPGPIILVDIMENPQLAPAAVPGGARLIVFARNPFLWIS